MFGQPLLDLGMFVRGVVVDDQVQVDLGQSLTINRVEKLDPLLMSMASLALSDQCSIEYANGGKQRRRAVAFVVVGHRPQPTGEHRQALLSPVEGLNLALFITREHQRMLG